MGTDTQLQLPDWVNNEFFAECLQEEIKETVAVTDFTTSTVVPPGNNYGSFIFRVNINYRCESKDSETQTISLIVKSELLDPIIKEMSTEIHKKEPFFYYNFLPKASKVGETYFAPRSFFSTRPTVTILEDLKDKGFMMADRMKQLDFEHCRLYMTAAATLHATSVAVFQHHPETIPQVNTSPMYSDDTPLTRNFFTTFIAIGMKLFIEEVEKLDPYKKYGELLKKIIPNLWSMLVDMHKPGEGINTIRQGDPWTTNMMFRYDDRGEPCDIRLIDFQGIQYGSPAPDIVFFIWSSANHDVKKTRLRDLYRIYVETFNTKLQQYECVERLNYQQFVADVRKATPQALFLAATMNPIFVHPEPVDFAGIFTKGREETETVLRKYYDSDFCDNHLPLLLECLEVNGVFDYLQDYING